MTQQDAPMHAAIIGCEVAPDSLNEPQLLQLPQTS